MSGQGCPRETPSRAGCIPIKQQPPGQQQQPPGQQQLTAARSAATPATGQQQQPPGQQQQQQTQRWRETEKDELERHCSNSLRFLHIAACSGQTVDADTPLPTIDVGQVVPAATADQLLPVLSSAPGDLAEESSCSSSRRRPGGWSQPIYRYCH
eukprot:gene15127-biopygen1533